MDVDPGFNLAGLVRNAKLVSYFNVASCCIQLYDIIITMDEEIRSIWTGRWTFSKILYLLVRYITVVEIGVIVWEQVVPGHWFRGCKISFEINVWLFVIGLGFGEMILSIRTWAVWKRSKKLGIFLLVFWPICWVGGFTIAGIFNRTVRFDPSPMAQFRGCFMTDASDILFVAWIILLLYDTVNLVLICIPAYKSFRLAGSSEFVRAVYTDGIVYYVYLFVLSVANIAVVVTMPRDLVTLLSMMERVLHSVLTCRVVLHIHSIANRQQFDTESASIPTYHPGNSFELNNRTKKVRATEAPHASTMLSDVGHQPTFPVQPTPGMKIVFAK